MAVYPVSPGRFDYHGTFIPEIWSGKIIENFYDATVLSAISNTNYEGEIRQYGDTVNIRQSPTITLKTYTKGQTLDVEAPETTKLQLLIDKGEYFACVEDDVDKVQTDIAMMDLWSKDASEKMKIKIDQRVLTDILTGVVAVNKGNTAGRITATVDIGSTGTPIALTKDNVLAYIIDHGVVLDEANAPEQDRFMVIPAKMAGLIKKSDLRDASITGDGTSPLRNGRIGMIDRFTLYVSHNLLISSGGKFNIIAGHKMGFTFASQMTNMETLRSQSTFGNIIRGLQVYGYKVIKGEALTHGVITMA